MAVFSMLLRVSLLALVGGLAAGSPFCDQQVPSVNLEGELDLIFVQAELESELVTKYPGELIGAYHSAIVLLGPNNQSWTIEFRAKDFIHAILPQWDPQENMDWGKAGVGYCMTEGILHGKPHWSHWQKIATVSFDDVRDMAANFLRPWMVDTQWSYQLFKVVDRERKPLLQDLTCSQGALSMIDYLNKTRRVPLIGFREAAALPTTRVELHVDSMEVVTGEELLEVKKFFQDASLLNAKGIRKFFDMIKAVRDNKYIRVGTYNKETFYRLHMRLPFLTVHYGTSADWHGAFPNSTDWSPPSVVDAKSSVIVV
eukprot:TRINITY_DN80845_c0_g1_i1.p1 TRINITY_DN80845_c0_g1~~TRINITY_DN80845_c0_g1_i1.p1  ORF type:complete len:313 (+),score=67.71 TRINITY_DN80845_c0_g1_i1:53-991(+)